MKTKNDYKEYKKLFIKTEQLQWDLMSIDEYSEKVYQAFERVIEELKDLIEEE